MQWDFAANLTQLLDLAERGDGPQTMSELIAAASSVVQRSQADPTQLRRWLDDNAQALVGQQLLVTVVHGQESPGVELLRVLRKWVAQTDDRTAAAAVEWLKEEHPGLLRAWLLGRVEELIAAELAAG